MSHSLSMSPERWQRLQTLFDQACALDPFARAEFVVRTCDDDLLLREQLLSLVLASTHDAEEFDEHVERELAQHAQAGAELEAGSFVGRYRIVRLLGRGGMGAVYLAERADNQFKQQVAIKVVADGALSARVAARLRSERQILANLNHPNIARLLDGGATGDGKPYFAMEFVDGQRIDRYCEDKQLSLTQRLQLFVQVCGAVQYAHQRLIIHRDLKPSNILVRADGVPKLLDFGIAKLVDPAQTDNVGLTRVYERVLSPESASPEQVRGEPLGTTSDVYALGVLLYELVSGLKAFNLNGRSFAEIAKMILEQTPAKPSLAVLAASKQDVPTASADTAKALQGDLDTIVLKALQKDASRRYETASALAEDIENYLGHRPLHARPDNLRYRARKFWQRNRWAVSSAAVVAVTIVSLVIFYTWRLTLERDTAERERLTADRVSSFMTEVFRVANPNESRGNTVPVREVLDAAMARIDKDLAHEPRVRLPLTMKMAQAYVGIGLWKQAQDQLRRAIQHERATFGATRVELAQALQALAAVQKRGADWNGELASLEESWSIRTALKANSGREAVLNLVDLARNHAVRSKLDDALATLHAAEQVLARSDSITPAERNQLQGYVLAGYGVAHFENAQYSKAEPYLRDALPHLRGFIEQGGDVYGDTLFALMQNLSKQNRVVDAQQQLRALLSEHTGLLGADHPLVAEIWNSLGVALCDNGEYVECSEAFQYGVDIQRKQPGPETMMLAVGYHNMGAARHDAGELVAALQPLQEAQGVLSRLRGDKDINWLPMLFEYADTLRDLGQLDKAEQSLTAAEALLAASNDKYYAGMLAVGRARMQLARRQFGAAADQARKAIEVIAPEDSRLLAHAHMVLGQSLLAQKRCAESIAEFQWTLDMRRKVMTQGNWFIFDAQNKLGDALSVCGQLETAEPLLVQSVERLQALRATDDWVLAGAQQKLMDHRQRVAGSKVSQ